MLCLTGIICGQADGSERAEVSKNLTTYRNQQGSDLDVQS